MPKIPRLLVAFAAFVAIAGSAVPAVAEELPPGFVDGQPVGAEPSGPADGKLGAEPVSPSTRTRSAPTSTAATSTTQRYFGADAYAGVRSAVESYTPPCTITDDGLTALVLAPVFRESSAATTAETAPAPMTLSRYDEWSGTFSETSNANANYGLYAFRDPYTPYQRAYWHPGLGIWQYDSAGLGAPFTTVEAMDTSVVARDVAREMATRYCAASGDGADKRAAAWSPWSGCNSGGCEQLFWDLYGTSPKFANLHLVDGISRLGGVVRHTCLLEGVAGTTPCWYVEPRVGVIEGATAWATLSPDGGSGPTVAPAPLSHPFYVVDRGTTEERHWLRVDTGYSIDVRASRTIGKNARPRSTQTGSGLAWSSDSSLCDLTTGRGSCVPIPPAGVSSRARAISSGFRPVALDANGDGRGDILWYRPGSQSDAVWLGLGSATFDSVSISVGSTYDDVLAGDVDDDGDDDVLWYSRATGVSYLWRSKGNGTFTSMALSPGSGRRPLLLDTNGDGDVEIFWYGPGSIGDSHWNWNGSGFSSSARSVSGTYTPIVGDFDDNGRQDIFWYAPGSTSDFLWLHTISGSVKAVAKSVSGTFIPRVGDLDGDDSDDIVWYAPGSAADYVWFGAPGASFSSQAMSVNASYAPFVADVLGTGRDSVFWYAPGLRGDYESSWSDTRARSTTPRIFPGQHVPVVGAFATGGGDGVLWYEPTLPTDVIWYR